MRKKTKSMLIWLDLLLMDRLIDYDQKEVTHITEAVELEKDQEQKVPRDKVSQSCLKCQSHKLNNCCVKSMGEKQLTSVASRKNGLLVTLLLK